MYFLFAILVLAAAASAETTGTTPNVRLVGTFQDDVLSGGVGHDLLIGGRGDDLLLGGPGHDELLGDHGDDRYVGGPGQDLFYFSRSEKGVKRIEDFTPNEDRIEVQFAVDLSRGLSSAANGPTPSHPALSWSAPSLWRRLTSARADGTGSTSPKIQA